MGFDGIMSLMNEFSGSLKILRSFGNELSDSMKHEAFFDKNSDDIKNAWNKFSDNIHRLK